MKIKFPVTKAPILERPPAWIFKATPKKKAFALELLENMTRAERKLWAKLSTDWKPQVVICGWIVDFYNPKLQVALEIDGPTHDEEYDAHRDSVLERYHIRTLRFKNFDVYKRIRWVLTQIDKRSQYGIQ